MEVTKKLSTNYQSQNGYQFLNSEQQHNSNYVFSVWSNQMRTRHSSKKKKGWKRKYSDDFVTLLCTGCQRQQINVDNGKLQIAS